MTTIGISIAVAIAIIGLSKRFKVDSHVAPRPELPRLGIAIICGDRMCSGDEWRPRKTFLNSRSECDTCGGRSYVLASTLTYVRRPEIPIERESFDAKGAVQSYYDSRRIM